MAEIRVFPVARRRGLIVKNARLAATYSDAGARNHLASVVAQHLKRLHRLLREINLALVETFDQLLCWEVNQPDVPQALEYRIRNCFADANSSDLMHHVIQTLQVLNVDRGIDVDARVQEFLDILPATFMATAGRIAMRQFVHKGDGGLARQETIEVHLFERSPLILDLFSCQMGQAIRHCLRLTAAMCLNDTDEHVNALAMQVSRTRQHGVGLPYTRGSAQENSQSAGSLAP